MMGGTVFLLIRHAATGQEDILKGRGPDACLNDLGRRQAEDLPGRLAGLPIDAVYSSPLERARETAAPLANALGQEIQCLDEALELDFGLWTGRTFAELEKDPLWRRFNVFRSGTAAPGGESMVQVQARFIRGLHGLAEEHPGKMVAVFSHQAPIRAVLCLYLGAPIDLYHRLAIGHASVSMVSVFEEGAEILRLNDTSEWPFANH